MNVISLGDIEASSTKETKKTCVKLGADKEIDLAKNNV